jgi:biopolymer transport protein ExbB
MNVAIQILAQVEDASAVQVQSVWDFVVKGGPMMVPIALASMVAVTVIVERLASLKRSQIIPPDFVPGLQNIITDHPTDRGRALTYCKEDASPIAQILGEGIRRFGESEERLEKHVEEQGARVVRQLRKNMRILVVIASIAPLMGLLGTIFGLINAFQTVAISGEALGKTEMLAKGIYEAMITTAAGLMVTIPVLIFHHWLSARIETAVSEMDRTTVEFLEDYVRKIAQFEDAIDGAAEDSGDLSESTKAEAA